MIDNRPTHLLDQEDCKQLRGAPFAVEFGALPDLVREALGPLGGIQPVTGEMIKAAGASCMTCRRRARSICSKAKARFSSLYFSS